MDTAEWSPCIKLFKNKNTTYLIQTPAHSTVYTGYIQYYGSVDGQVFVDN